MEFAAGVHEINAEIINSVIENKARFGVLPLTALAAD